MEERDVRRNVFRSDGRGVETTLKVILTPYTSDRDVLQADAHVIKFPCLLIEFPYYVMQFAQKSWSWFSHRIKLPHLDNY